MYIRILKTVGWVSLVGLVVIGTIALIGVGRGYSYDFHTGRLKLNGLVIFASSPGNASITVNDKSTRHKTPYRTTLETGDYNFEVTKSGYKTWSKRISVEASEVSWVQYILLIPNKLNRQSWVSTAKGLSLLATSRDHHHFAYVDSSDNAIWVFDSSSHHPTKLYTPAAPVAGGSVEIITAMAWSGDASRLLVTTQADSKTYQRLVNVSDGNVVKMTEQYGFDFGDLSFNPANTKQLFWVSPEGLRRIDTDSQTVSAVLADNVASYVFGADGQIIYVQATTLGKSVFSMDTGGANKREVIQSVAESAGYKIVYASYRGSDMLAILPSDTHTITLYSEITTDNPLAKVITKSANDMTFGPDGRFINYRSGQRLSTYDLELNRTYNFAASATPYQSVTWFDTYHLLTDNGSSLSLIEYDGGNPATLSSKYLAGLSSYTSNQHEVLVVEPGSGTTVQINAIAIKP